jgi:hypothetical protein
MGDKIDWGRNEETLKILVGNRKNNRNCELESWVENVLWYRLEKTKEIN